MRSACESVCLDNLSDEAVCVACWIFVDASNDVSANGCSLFASFCLMPQAINRKIMNFSSFFRAFLFIAVAKLSKALAWHSYVRLRERPEF